MYSGVSGLRGHQTYLDTVGNNIANVNTTGYKSSSVVFSDMLSQILSGAGAPTALAGGTNPAQVGLGTSIAGIQTNFTQGAVQLTGRATDMAIQGEGFFVTQIAGQRQYTRAGSLSFDAAGQLVTPSGAVVQGWAANAQGQINTNGPIGNLGIPIGQILEPVATESVSIGGNLPADATVADSIVTSIDVVDEQGGAHPLSLTWTKLADNQWEVTAEMPDAAGVMQPVAVSGGTGTPANVVNFDPLTGLPDIEGLTMAAGDLVTASGAQFSLDVELDFGEAGDADGLVQFAGESTMSALSQDGAEIGFLRSFSIDQSGIISGVFSNGLRRNLGQVALANFNNPGGLERVGDTSFIPSPNSGEPQLGIAGQGGLGSISGGSVEMSNVDLAAEFTNMIAAQRGFQANSRVISASDEILQDLVNLKR
ncbi:flagellar hook protein FlgE [Euzebya sp.]